MATNQTKNPDLENERSKATFNKQILTHLLDGSPSKTSRRHQLRSIIENDPIFSNTNNAYMHRTERHINALKKTIHFLKLCRQHGIYNKENGEITQHEDFHLFIYSIADDPLPIALHYIMFLPNIRALGDDEQQRKWLKECRDWNMIGCYAQTELGHGSNIRALETTATFRSEEECGLKGGGFVIHSPTITSTKFWPGTLGKTANHAMVIAQLIDGKGQNHGIHNFLVPLRCPKTHKHLPGVTTGDIGPKLGYNNMDNGYASFNKVLIPRRNMPMRFATVNEQGIYSKTKNVSEATSKVSYITMMDVRVLIICDSGLSLARACTIVLRYSAQRRQGYIDESSKQEQQVLDYTMQQYRILPLLACCYIFHFTGKCVKNTLTSMQQRLLSTSSQHHPTKIEMQDFHATTSALKSFCTTVASDGIEDCRKACGGHGYLVSSGLVELSNTYLSNNTVEGDNFMLPQHVIKVLLKLIPAVQGVGSIKEKEKLKSAYQYCNSLYLIDPLYDMIHDKTTSPNVNLEQLNDTNTLPFLLEAFAHRSARLLLQIGNTLQNYVMDGKSLSEAWNLSLILMHNASQAHALYIVLNNFYNLIVSQENGKNDVQLGDNEIHVLKELGHLFGYYWIYQSKGDYLFDNYLTSEQITFVLQNIINKLLPSIRNEAIGLVDAFDFSDFLLKTALGNYNGNVYQEIMNSSYREPLNGSDEGYIKYLKELIVGDVAVWKGNRVEKDEGDVRSKL